MLPLPEGEGWGEGKRRVHSRCASISSTITSTRLFSRAQIFCVSRAALTAFAKSVVFPLPQ